jgi:hypothetical protein
MRAVFFEEDDAQQAAARLAAAGYAAHVARDRLAGEDDDEDHPWAVDTDAPAASVESLVEELDGWLDAGERDDAPPAAPLDLPSGPRRVKGHWAE